MYNETVTAFNQGGKRPGAAVIHLPFWHPEIVPFLQLKLEGGTEETRARRLKYSVILNGWFMDAVQNDEDIYLFSPHDYPELNETWGDKWNEIYAKAIKDNPNTKKVRARDLAYHLIKARTETGNVYIFWHDNVNERVQNNHLARNIGYINSSNLCTEIMQPSSPGPEGISLCTLGSINSHWFSHEESVLKKRRVVRILYKALRNSIRRQHYPFSETRNSAVENMFIGVGIFNYAYMLASHNFNFSSPVGKILGKRVVEEIRGYLDKENSRRHGQPDGNPSKLLMAIAPTASSSRITGGTESVDPIRKPLVRFEGTISLPFVVPEFKRLSKYYQNAMDVNPYDIIDHAARRQLYIDQGQSVSLWIDYETSKSFKKLWEIHDYAYRSGLKSLYYLHTIKEEYNPDEECESCT